MTLRTCIGLASPLLWPSAALGQEALLPGPYLAGELGAVELRAEEGRVLGVHQGGGACSFQQGERILEGQLEGNVLVGTVTLCQSGSGCGQQSYPLLAFLDPASRTLVADIKLTPSCSSPALQGSRLWLTPAPEQERRVDPPIAEAASLVAKQKLGPKRSEELVQKAVRQGNRLLELGDPEGAAVQFELGLSYDEESWPAQLGLGRAAIELGQIEKAIWALERARELARASGKANHSSIYYYLACAHSRIPDRKSALSHLRRAVKLGYLLPRAQEVDPRLAKIVGAAPELRRLTRAWPARGQNGPGKVDGR